MKKSLFWLIILFIILTTYNPKKNLLYKFTFNINHIEIENNKVVDTREIKEKLTFLYSENLLFLNTKVISTSLSSITFIDSFSIKKIYPNKIKLLITEKIPIAILQNKKNKYYISDKGDLINFKKFIAYNNLPIVFGGRKFFYSLYKELHNIKFPLKIVKSFYFYESGRWDLITHDNKVIKLPIKNYLSSLENFMISKNNDKFKNFKVFDYRIKNQLILN